MHHKRKSVPTSLTKLYQDGCSALPFEIHIVPGPETMKMRERVLFLPFISYEITFYLFIGFCS
jgi:hypothetical protein